MAQPPRQPVSGAAVAALIRAGAAQPLGAAPPPPAPPPDTAPAKAALATLLAEMSGPAFGVRVALDAAKTLPPTAGIPPVEAASLGRVTELMSRLSADMEAHAGGTASAAGALEAVSDDVLNAMMKEFERMGQADDFGAAVDGVMRQLLSKDILYVPMKQLCELVSGGGGGRGGWARRRQGWGAAAAGWGARMGRARRLRLPAGDLVRVVHAPAAPAVAARRGAHALPPCWLLLPIVHTHARAREASCPPARPPPPLAASCAAPRPLRMQFPAWLAEHAPHLSAHEYQQ